MMTEKKENKKDSSEPSEGAFAKQRKTEIFFNLFSFGLARSHLFDIVWSHCVSFGKNASVVLGFASLSQAVCGT